MGISPEVNGFCILIITLVFVLLIYHFLLYFFEDLTYLDQILKPTNRFQTFIKPTDDIYVSVVYKCDGTINSIIEQIKSLISLYENNFNSKKVEILAFADPKHNEIRDISLLNKVFPNLVLIQRENNESKDFLLAAARGKGEFIVESTTFVEEIENIKQNPKKYISFFEKRRNNKKYFSAVSKDVLSYLSRIHFVNSNLVEEFLLICKKNKLTTNTLPNKTSGNEISIMQSVKTKTVLYIATFLYKVKFWRIDSDNVESIRKAKKKEE